LTEEPFKNPEGGRTLKITQISVFLENKQGRIRDITQVLAEKKIDIRALSIAETRDFGVLRMIVDKPDFAYESLKEAGFVVRQTAVLAVEIEDTPGGLNNTLKILEENQLNIEYMYAFVEKASEKALMVMRFDDADKAQQVLEKQGISLVSPDKIYNL
jgi:hypothetical protein